MSPGSVVRRSEGIERAVPLEGPAQHLWPHPYNTPTSLPASTPAYLPPRCTRKPSSSSSNMNEIMCLISSRPRSGWLLILAQNPVSLARPTGPGGIWPSPPHRLRQDAPIPAHCGPPQGTPGPASPREGPQLVSHGLSRWGLPEQPLSRHSSPDLYPPRHPVRSRNGHKL